MLVPNRYKTVKCQQFHQEGYCHYGPRCQFLHNERKNRHKLKKIPYKHVTEALSINFQKKGENYVSLDKFLAENLNLASYSLPRLPVFASLTE